MTMLSPNAANDPYVDALRILSDQTCSSWYLARIVRNLYDENCQPQKDHR
jgi:hypothetical protein